MKKAIFNRFSTLFNPEAKTLLAAERAWSQEMSQTVYPLIEKIEARIKSESILDLEEALIEEVTLFHRWLSKAPKPIAGVKVNPDFFYFSEFECVGLKKNALNGLCFFTHNLMLTLPPFLAFPVLQAHGLPELDSWIEDIRKDLTLYDLWLANPPRALVQISQNPDLFLTLEDPVTEHNFRVLPSGLIIATSDRMTLSVWAGDTYDHNGQFFYRKEGAVWEHEADKAKVTLAGILRLRPTDVNDLQAVTEEALAGACLNVDVFSSRSGRPI